ncbi:MAG: hypothetical protein GTO60_16750 [Gammaproteobacteria bacterium]|nr:hypothetical protein [Gammaproteobacteria bacterium]
MLSFRVNLDNLWIGLVDTDPEPTAELDIAKYVGNIFINVSQAAGGSDTLAVVVEHATTSGGTFAAVPASALFDPATGDAATFANLAALATDQTLALNRQQLKRYVRVKFTGASANDNNVSVVAGAQPQYTEQ